MFEEQEQKKVVTPREETLDGSSTRTEGTIRKGEAIEQCTSGREPKRRKSEGPNSGISKIIEIE